MKGINELLQSFHFLESTMCTCTCRTTWSRWLARATWITRSRITRATRRSWTCWPTWTRPTGSWWTRLTGATWITRATRRSWTCWSTWTRPTGSRWARRIKRRKRRERRHWHSRWGWTSRIARNPRNSRCQDSRERVEQKVILAIEVFLVLSLLGFQSYS